MPEQWQQDLKSWMCDNLDVTSQEQAVELGDRLMEVGLFKHIKSQHPFRDGDTWYQFEPQYQMTATTAKTRSGLLGSRSGGGVAVGATAGVRVSSGMIDQEMTAKAKEALNADNAKLKMEKAGQDNALQLI